MQLVVQNKIIYCKRIQLEEEGLLQIANKMCQGKVEKLAKMLQMLGSDCIKNVHR